METLNQEKTAINEAKKMILGDLWDLCYRAHSHTSFSPERRANSYVKEYSELLESDLKELGENKGNYREKFINKFGDWMRAKGNCMSSMITGGSNFPVSKANKANARERKKSDDFSHWRKKYFDAVNRVPTKSPEDDRDEAERKLEKLVNAQLEMKEINAEIRKSKIKDLEPLIKHLTGVGFNSVLISLIDNFSSRNSGKYKISGFTLTNNNANIKAAEKKIKMMDARIKNKNTWEDIIFTGGYITIEDNRVKIFHDEKPEKEIIQEIKKSGFRWSPNWKCWCRKHTGNALFAVKYLSFIKE